MKKDLFSESCSVPWLTNRTMWARVEADESFVHVITDDYEGDAMMSHELAERVHEMLGRALEAVRAAKAVSQPVDYARDKQPAPEPR